MAPIPWRTTRSWPSTTGSPPYEVQTLEAVLAGPTSQARFNVLLFGTFGAVALVLGAAGIFGILSIFASRRQREIGIRMALGASRGHVLRMVIGRGMKKLSSPSSPP